MNKVFVSGHAVLEQDARLDLQCRYIAGLICGSLPREFEHLLLIAVVRQFG